MSIASSGPAHDWFAWRPVRTDYFGWVWLRTVTRKRTYLDIWGSPDFWEYTRKEKP